MEKMHIWSRLGKMENPVRIPVVELCGRNRLLIENHMGVLGYGMREIRIKVSYGSLLITGRDLKLMELCKEQLVIIGYIDSLTVLGGEL